MCDREQFGRARVQIVNSCEHFRKACQHMRTISNISEHCGGAESQIVNMCEQFQKLNIYKQTFEKHMLCKKRKHLRTLKKKTLSKSE